MPPFPTATRSGWRCDPLDWAERARPTPPLPPSARALVPNSSCARPRAPGAAPGPPPSPFPPRIAHLAPMSSDGRLGVAETGPGGARAGHGCAFARARCTAPPPQPARPAAPARGRRLTISAQTAGRSDGKAGAPQGRRMRAPGRPVARLHNSRPSRPLPAAATHPPPPTPPRWLPRARSRRRSRPRRRATEWVGGWGRPGRPPLFATRFPPGHRRRGQTPSRSYCRTRRTPTPPRSRLAR